MKNRTYQLIQALNVVDKELSIMIKRVFSQTFGEVDKKTKWFTIFLFLLLFLLITIALHFFFENTSNGRWMWF